MTSPSPTDMYSLSVSCDGRDHDDASSEDDDAAAFKSEAAQEKYRSHGASPGLDSY